MYFPFITKRSDQTLHRRKGGGGRGGGGAGRGGGGGGGGSGRSAGSINSGGSSRGATAFGGGGGRSSTIPSGQLYAGRSIGGGTRSQVYGTKQYGSGYPGVTTRGVAGRGFPFYFWPVAFVPLGGGYLYSRDYGDVNNSSRPGGPLMVADFNSANPEGSTFRLLSDNETVTSLIQDLTADCSSNLQNTTITAQAYTNDSTVPKPEQVVQYYRATSVALSLDGYNNTAIFADEGTPDVPLPSNINTNLLDCLNQTIGEAVPLVDGTALRFNAQSGMSLFGLVYVFWCLGALL